MCIKVSLLASLLRIVKKRVFIEAMNQYNIHARVQLPPIAIYMLCDRDVCEAKKKRTVSFLWLRFFFFTRNSHTILCFAVCLLFFPTAFACFDCRSFCIVSHLCLSSKIAWERMTVKFPFAECIRWSNRKFIIIGFTEDWWYYRLYTRVYLV